MNKLGFYIENTTTPFLREALRAIKPPTLLIHAGDRGLLREIRNDLSPDSFVIGRMFIPLSEQDAWLDDPDPAGRGRAFAQRILDYDMQLATERGANGRYLIDAWMGLNECLRGPASFPDGAPDAVTQRRADALDRFQFAFCERLRDAGSEAVAFNFGAGNYTRPEHYVNLFPRTLAYYTYLGFHEYGWPTLMPRDGSASAALLYRRCMTGIRQRFGPRHQIIVTEAGLARMYRHPNDGAGDVGWLFPGDSIPEDQYFESLGWYNGELLRDSYVMGACLFTVGHSGRWETFRHLGNDNQGKPIGILNRVAALGPTAPAPRPQPPAAPTPTPKPPPPQAPELPPAMVTALRKRLLAVETYLQLTVKQTTRLLGIHTELRQTTATLLSETARLPSEKELVRVDQQLTDLERAIERMTTSAASGHGSIVYPANLAQLKWRAARLRSTAGAIRADTGRARILRTGALHADATLNKLVPAYRVVPALHQRAAGMLKETATAKARLRTGRWAEDEGAPFRDAVEAGLDGEPAGFAMRDLAAIRWIVVHHTGHGLDAAPAESAVQSGLHGLPYHFVVLGDGTALRTRPVTARAAPLAGYPEGRRLSPGWEEVLESAGIAVALAGGFDAAVPTDAQLKALADLVRWLMTEHELETNAIVGVAELTGISTSPGIQWLQGYQYKLALLERLPGGLTALSAI